uniref:Pyrin domain-containing protein n=1 Tax=Oryzias latipes TaxID=8090 RepID=A0A3P9HIV3_ORYLA
IIKRVTDHELLLESLEQLRTVDFEKFQWYLTEGVLQSFKSIPRSHLEHASRPETVTRIVERYGEDKAVEITIQILREIGNNNEAEKLMKAHSGKHWRTLMKDLQKQDFR